MISRLLRLIPSYRALESDLAVCADSRISAESDARLWKSRHDALEIDRDRLRDEHTTALRRVANWMALYSGNPVLPFPEVAITPPPREESEDDALRPPARRHPRDVEREARQKSRQEAAARRAKLMNDLDALPSGPGGQTQ